MDEHVWYQVLQDASSPLLTYCVYAILGRESLKRRAFDSVGTHRRNWYRNFGSVLDF